MFRTGFLGRGERWILLVIISSVMILALVSLFVVADRGPTAPKAEASVSENQAIGGGQTITIGVGTTISVAGSLGWRQANAARLAVDEVNAAGGIDVAGTFYTITLVHEDTGCVDPGRATAAANNLLSAGAVAVVGHSCSTSSLAAQPIYAAAGVAMISPSSTSPQLTDLGYTTTFRVVSRDDAILVVAAQYVLGPLSASESALVSWVGLEFSSDSFRDAFVAGGGAVTSQRTVSDTAQYTSTLTAIQVEDPDVIYLAVMSPIDAGLFSKIADGLGMGDVPVVWNAFASNRDVLNDYASEAGAAAEDDLALMAQRDTDDMAGYAAMNANYQAAGFPEFGDEAQIWGAFAYDATRIVIEAIDRADSTDPGDIRDEVAAMSDYSGVVGYYHGFDSKGDVIPQWGWIELYRNGIWRKVWPPNVYLPVVIKP